MAIANTLSQYLADNSVDFEITRHPHTPNSTYTAQASHVPGECLAKAVMLEDEHGYVMAVIPSTHRLKLADVHHGLQRMLGLATEGELAKLFPDCEPGAVPPVGRAYGLETLVDEDLLGQSEIWLEGGDHEELVHVGRTEFKALMAEARTGRYSRHR